MNANEQVREISDEELGALYHAYTVAKREGRPTRAYTAVVAEMKRRVSL